MMNQEQEKRLLEYLAGLGFKGERFTAELLERARFDPPDFSVQEVIPFGEERMTYELFFTRDPQFDAYRLQEYHATHRSAVPIAHQSINGIDTAVLEEKMRGVDWETYFKEQDKITDPARLEDIRKTVAELTSLAANQNFDGIKIQDELIYKYWPAGIYTSEEYHGLKMTHEDSRDFIATGNGICNANLAYYIVSGRLDKLHERLQPLALGEWPGIDFYRKIEAALSANKTEFNLFYAFDERKGYTEINVPVTTVADEFNLDTYNVKFTPHPILEPGVYNGVDSGKLEHLMQAINWHEDDELFIHHDDEREPEFTPKVDEVLSLIHQMEKDDAGIVAADKLMVKYWSDCVYFDSMIREEGWKYLEQLPNFQQDFPMELNVKSAYNVLNGRAIPEEEMFPSRPASEEWLRLNLAEKDGNGKYPVVQAGKLSLQELESILDVFPIVNMSYYQVKNSLLRGDLCPVNLKNDKKVLMELNPEQRTVNVYTTDMRPIPVNVHLDPDWKPPLSNQQEKVKQQEEEPKVKYHKYNMIRPKKKNRGKGL